MEKVVYFSYTPVMRLTNFIGMHYMLGLRTSYIPCQLAPHLGVLSVKKTDTLSVLQTGRAFQRLWLALTKQGYVLQPMPASAIYALQENPAESTEVIPSALQQQLSIGWQKVIHKNIPLMLFRIGNAASSPVIANRPELSSFLNSQ